MGREWAVASFACAAAVIAYLLAIFTGNDEESLLLPVHAAGAAVESVQASVAATAGVQVQQAANELATATRLLALAQAAERQGQLAEAVRLYQLALAHGQDDRWSERLSALREHLQQRENADARVTEILAQAARCEQDGRFQEAWTFYQRLAVVDISPPVQTKIDRCRQIIEMERALQHALQQGEILLDKGDWAAAIDHYDNFARIHNNWPASKQESALVRAGIRRIQTELSLLKQQTPVISRLLQQERAAKALQYVTDLPSTLPKLGLQNKIRQQLQREMTLVDAGPFTMGSMVETDEAPPRTVSLPAYYLDRYEVSNRQYAFFVAETGAAAPVSWQTKDSLRDWEPHPVSGISWDEAQQYAEWAGKRLPTEAEWEKAARGSDGRLYPWGELFATSRCNALETGLQRSAPVGSFPAGISASGCFDMAGNVLEWTADVYAPYPGGQALSMARDDYRVARGGSWYYSGSLLRCSNRFPHARSVRLLAIGFRCALDYHGVAQEK